MYKIELRRRTIGVTPFKWGLYFHLRWKQHWLHFKIGAWWQDGLRVSTRRQLKQGRKPRYVNSLRCQVSIWHTHHGHQGKPIVFGVQLYGGRPAD